MLNLLELEHLLRVIFPEVALLIVTSSARLWLLASVLLFLYSCKIPVNAADISAELPVRATDASFNVIEPELHYLLPLIEPGYEHQIKLHFLCN